MQYIYEFEIWRGQEQWIAEAFDLPEALTQGEDMRDVCESAVDIVREIACDKMIHKEPMPEASFDNKPTHGGILAIIAVDASLSDIAKMTASEAAAKLGVSRGRISAMLASGILEGWREGRNTFVTAASVDARLASKAHAGRPRKNTITATRA